MARKEKLFGERPELVSMINEAYSRRALSGIAYGRIIKSACTHCGAPRHAGPCYVTEDGQELIVNIIHDIDCIRYEAWEY